MNGCRTDSPEPREPLQLRQEPFALDVMADPLPVEALTEIKGFDQDGEVQCLPLPEAAAGEAPFCIPRQDPLDGQCAASRGQVLICQDCSRMCSAPLGSLPPNS